MEQQWKIQVNPFQLQNMGPAYFVDTLLVHTFVAAFTLAVRDVQNGRTGWDGLQFAVVKHCWLLIKEEEAAEKDD